MRYKLSEPLIKTDLFDEPDFNCVHISRSILIFNAIKVPQWYSVQEGDATMIHIAS